MNTGAEVTICHMLGKCEENSVSYLQVFFSFFQHFFFSLGEDICYIFISFYSKENGFISGIVFLGWARH